MITWDQQDNWGTNCQGAFVIAHLGGIHYFWILYKFECQIRIVLQEQSLTQVSFFWYSSFSTLPIAPTKWRFELLSRKEPLNALDKLSHPKKACACLIKVSTSNHNYSGNRPATLYVCTCPSSPRSKQFQGQLHRLQFPRLRENSGDFQHLSVILFINIQVERHRGARWPSYEYLFPIEPCTTSRSCTLQLCPTWPETLSLCVALQGIPRQI